ncbi:hypothetical protein ACJJIQ_08545 [Microbulbifer sp. ANSA003]|uniref:hypothetical protein n=1 Tax=Microbulbifer sp. ANSA003 TaxID=3243360 RepID=UPI004041D6A7
MVSTEEKVSGWLIITYSILMLLISSAILLFLYAVFGNSILSMPFNIFSLMGLIIILFASLNILGVLAGIAVLLDKRYAPELALIFSTVSVLNVPLGTLVGGFYLWLYIRKYK